MKQKVIDLLVSQGYICHDWSLTSEDRVYVEGKLRPDILLRLVELGIRYIEPEFMGSQPWIVIGC